MHEKDGKKSKQGNIGNREIIKVQGKKHSKSEKRKVRSKQKRNVIHEPCKTMEKKEITHLLYRIQNVYGNRDMKIERS